MLLLFVATVISRSSKLKIGLGIRNVAFLITTVENRKFSNVGGCVSGVVDSNFEPVISL